MHALWMQIRSHAQKYFQKQVKEGNSAAVPPPRPKRQVRRTLLINCAPFFRSQRLLGRPLRLSPVVALLRCICLLEPLERQSVQCMWNN